MKLKNIMKLGQLFLINIWTVYKRSNVTGNSLEFEIEVVRQAQHVGINKFASLYF